VSTANANPNATAANKPPLDISLATLSRKMPQGEGAENAVGGIRCSVEGRCGGLVYLIL